MEGQCPLCGVRGSLEMFVTDAAWKKALAVGWALPSEVQPYLLDYLRLFSPPKRALTAKRTLRILEELRDLMATGTVQWDKSEVRPAPAFHWADTLRAIVEMDPEKRPAYLDDNNYLRKAAWNRARGAAARAESERENARRFVRLDPAEDRRDPVEGKPAAYYHYIPPEQPEPEQRATKEDFAALKKAVGGMFSGPKDPGKNHASS